jgi:hypothetical protein
MLDSDGFTQGIQMNNTVIFRAIIGVSLGGRQLHFEIFDHLRRHIRLHVVFGAAQDAVTRQADELAGWRVLWHTAWVNEAEDVDEVVRRVLDWGAGQCPASGSADTLDHLGRLGITVLNPLGFVQ